MTESTSTSTDYNEWYSKVESINEKFTCDKCGKKWRLVELSRVAINWATPENCVDRVYELCPNCQKAVFNFIEVNYENK